MLCGVAPVSTGNMVEGAGYLWGVVRPGNHGVQCFPCLLPSTPLWYERLWMNHPPSSPWSPQGVWMGGISALAQPCVTAIGIGGSLLSANHLFALFSVCEGGSPAAPTPAAANFPPQHSYRPTLRNCVLKNSPCLALELCPHSTYRSTSTLL